MKLEFNYLCTFTQCEQRFQTEVNIVYSATVQKMLLLMNRLITEFSPMNATQFRTNVMNVTNKRNLDLVISSEALVRGAINHLVDLFFTAYRQYISNMKVYRTVLLILANLIATSFILFVLFTLNISSNQKYLSRIVDVFRNA